MSRTAPGPTEEAALPIVDPDATDELIAKLLSGGIVAIPTDTVYGLAALPTHAGALQGLADLKGRESDQPIAVLIDTVVALAPYLEDPAALDRVVPLWPGALTAVVRARTAEDAAGEERTLFSPVITEAGTIGVRKPADPFARRVIRGCGGLLAVTSANRHGEAPATTAAEVAWTFGEGLLVLDGGARGGNIASTVVDLTEPTPRILREGPVSASDLGIEHDDR